MGGSHSRRRHSNHNNPGQHASSHTPPPPPLPEISANRLVFAAATPYPPPYPNAVQYYPYSGYYQPSPLPHMPLPAPYDHHHRGPPHAVPYPYGPVPPAPIPIVELQKAVTIRSDINLRKETLRVEPDEENPGKYLVAFTFDATAAGSITVIFFAKECEYCNLMSTKESLQPVTVSFKQGLGQKFRQPSGTGIGFVSFDESELQKDADMKMYPLAVKIEVSALDDNGSGAGIPVPGSVNSEITQAVFEKKEGGEYQVRVVKQILWANGVRYELQEIYGVGNSVHNEVDGNDPGKECVICLSEPRDTTVLPCRHMCMCSGCAKVLRFQANGCPICRQPVKLLLEIKVNTRPDESVN